MADDLIVKYAGEDITDMVSITRCWHDMHAWSILDELSITFDDAGSSWGAWAPKADDVIEVSNGAARTGKMYVRAVQPSPSAMDLRAYPVPHTMREKKCRSWESVRLRQLIAQIADDAGMEHVLYGIDDYLYSYVEQRDESDLAFLGKRLAYEGASLVPFDGKLIIYSGRWAESQAATNSLEITSDADFECDDNAARFYGSCFVTDGTTQARFRAGDGRELPCVLDDRISDSVEAMRFARGLLRKANRESSVIRLRTDSLLDELAACSVVDIEADAVPSWNGKTFVAHARHDYYNEQSKIWLTRLLGDY